MPKATSNAGAGAGPPRPPVPPATYTVLAGDTLSGIGARLGIDWKVIARLNNLEKPSLIRPGQTLRLRADAAPPAPARPAASGVSPNGMDFLFEHEAQRGVSDRPHWPKGASGVTIGPGYDLRHRTAAEVVRDLTAAGMDAAMAGRLAKGCGLGGADAKAFCAANPDLRVTPAQERALLAKVVGPYAGAVREAVRVPLTQNQFDALVSFAYNIGAPGFRGSSTLQRLNQGDHAGAAAAMAMWNKSGGKVVQGLVNRRADEITLFSRPSAPAG